MTSISLRQFAGSGTFIALISCFLTASADSVTPNPPSLTTLEAASIQRQIATLTMPLEANVGQEDKHVAFTARSRKEILFVTRDGELVHSFPGRKLGFPIKGNPPRARTPGWVVTESLIKAHPTIRGKTASATRVSRFIGRDPALWRASLPTFQQVSLGEAWPGIELELAVHPSSVEKLFTVAPRADARQIAIVVKGAKRLALNADGVLHADTGNGPITFSKPRAWQDVAGKRHFVRVAYSLSGDRYGFVLGHYDPAYAVVIDPLLQATYLGSTGDDWINAIALDANGNVFVAGKVDSTTFPGTAGGAQANANANDEAFVAKLSNDLQTLLQATYLGGSGYDQAGALTLDAGGDVYVAGSTGSPNFPLGTGCNSMQSTSGGATDAFVALLNNTLTALTCATYLGGPGLDGATAIVLAANGDVLVTGSTTGSFPGTASGAQPSFAGGSTFGDAFVARLKGDLTGPSLGATYLGGSLDEYATSIAQDAGGVFIAGFTFSSANFPVTPGAPQGTYGGGTTGFGGDAFVAKLSSNLANFLSVTYLGGSSQDTANTIGLDASGNVFVAGITASLNFPVTGGAFQSTKSAYADAFVAKYDNGLTTRLASTFLGASQDDGAYALAFDTSGNVFVAGSTASSNFPGVGGGAQSSFSGGTTSGFSGDVFVARFDNTLASLTQATYLGGSGDERANAITLNPANNNVFVAGMTSSVNFPGTAGGAQQTIGGTLDNGFVARLTRGLHDVANSTGNNDGDPHLATTDGVHYDFQGAGEYVALRDSRQMEIQTRQTPVQTPWFLSAPDPYDGIASCVSINTAVAARVGDHRVSYEPNVSGVPDPSGMQLRVDGKVIALNALGLNLGSGGRVAPAPAGSGIEVDFPDGTVLFAIPTWWFYLSMWFLNVDVYHTEATDGLMGKTAHGSWLPALPNGASVGPMPLTVAQRYATLYNNFGNAWRVNGAASLFDYKPGTSTATFTATGWPKQSLPCEVPRTHVPLVKPVELAVAQKACHAVEDKNARANCVFDVRATGETGFAAAYLVGERLRTGATVTTVKAQFRGSKLRRQLAFAATVRPLTASSQAIPTGTVQFAIDGRNAGKPVALDKNGQAQWSTADPTTAGHTIMATYKPASGSLFLPSSGYYARGNR